MTLTALSCRYVVVQLDLERRARQVAVPTDPEQVKLKLRELGKPICLFGEDVRLGHWAVTFEFQLARMLRVCRLPRVATVCGSSSPS